MFEIVETEYLTMDFCGPRIETYYSFDNSKGQYYCYVDIDEDISRTTDWYTARREYIEASKVKVVEKKSNCK